MYPFDDGPGFVTRAWYVAAWSGEVTEVPIARTVLGQSIVLYRAADGAAVALANRCPHRGLPLAMGRVVGNDIECGYHGFTFSSDGGCCRIPSQELVPRGFGVHSYPVAERWQWIWIWMGDPAASDDTLLPDVTELGLAGPPWLAVPGGDFSVRARYQLFNENLLDLTHLAYLHPETIGTADILKTTPRIEVDGRVVRVSRDTLEEQASPFYARRLGIPVGRIDRRHVTSFVAPSFHIIHVTAAEAGTLGTSAPHIYGEHKILHAITPETPQTLHDFWAITRTYNTADETTTFLRNGINDVIRQDIVALEATESLIDDSHPIVDLSCRADEAALKRRRVVQELLRMERVPHHARVRTRTISRRSK
jgi:vanillate O-demethylase monooxygenase subunit